MGFKVTRNGRQVRYCQSMQAVKSFIDSCLTELNQKSVKIIDSKVGNYQIEVYEYEQGVRDDFIIEDVSYHIKALRARTA